jgi:hypothetical protein
MKRGYRTGWRIWKGPEQGRSAGRPSRACSKELLNLAVVVSFRHALSVASLPRLRFVRLVGLPASRMIVVPDHIWTRKRASAPRGGIVEVERTKHLYQADEFFGLGI